MKIVWHQEAWEEFAVWFKNDKNVTKRILLLVEDMFNNPSEGIGKPEPLKYQLAGCWSRRITEEHRLIYQYQNDQITIIACKYHY